MPPSHKPFVVRGACQAAACSTHYLQRPLQAEGAPCCEHVLILLHVAAQADVDDLEQLLAQLDDVEDDGQGQGDLLDDFVLSATQVTCH